MKKIIFVIAICLFLVGCGGNNEVDTTNPFLGGTTGLRMSFIEGAPPSEVFDQGEYPFEIALQIENMGEADVAASDAKITILGIDPQEFSKSQSDFVNNPREDLTGSKKDTSGNRVEGTLTEINIQNLNYEGNVVGASVKRPIVANICYDYKTTVVADLCIVKNVLKDNSQVCKVSEMKTAYSSGGPIQISSITEKSAGANKIDFEFTIENLGAVGGIYKESTECEDVRSQEDVVTVEVTGLDDISCAGLREDGTVTLIENKKNVRCSFEPNSETDFERTITISLGYGIKDDISTSITIKSAE